MFSYTAKLKCYDAHVCQLVPLISFEGPQHLEVLVGDRKSMHYAACQPCKFEFGLCENSVPPNPSIIDHVPNVNWNSWTIPYYTLLQNTISRHSHIQAEHPYSILVIMYIIPSRWCSPVILIILSLVLGYRKYRNKKQLIFG